MAMGLKGISLLGLLLLVFVSKGEAMESKHVVLLGASVGQAWHIEDLPKRLGIQGYRFEYRGEYQFDKSKSLQQILERKKNKPDAIFLKECAAYFPGDRFRYEELMKEWVRRCKQGGIIPIPTTVVPVIQDRSLKNRAKDLIKGALGRPTSTSQLEAIIQYNDWVRSFARTEGLAVLDLDAAVRTSQKDRSLRLDLQSGDGLHLNEKAYALLDKIVVPILENVFPPDQKH